MSTHNTCLYKEVDKKYTGCNLKTEEFLDSALIGVCVVIRSNRVCCGFSWRNKIKYLSGYPFIWSYRLGEYSENVCCYFCTTMCLGSLFCCLYIPISILI